MNSDIDRFKNVIKHANIGIDPIWLQDAVDYIEHLQHIIDTIIDAPNMDAQLDAINDAQTERQRTWHK